VVNILGRVQVGSDVWYRIGDEGAEEQYVHSQYVRVVTTTARPKGVAPDEKWIAVNRAEQTVAAYQGDQMVFATLASTGLPWWQTPDGTFRVWLKRRIGDMTGGSPDGDYYYLVEDVPWTMYFDGPYALHAAYWHDDFGYEHSRGCVNLAPHDARWLFDWADGQVPSGEPELFFGGTNLGTWVHVYSTPAGAGL
jgi:lipoprotein-anchoring transpeptidase ErfK/SrfK